MKERIRELLKELMEGPNDCYHKYSIKTSNNTIPNVGFYFGSPSSNGVGSFSCNLSNQLHSMLDFSINPNKVVSIKETAPTNPHGFRSNNCISFEGTFANPNYNSTPQHITDILGGPAFIPTVVTYNSVQECMEDYKFVDREYTYKKRKGDFQG